MEGKKQSTREVEAAVDTGVEAVLRAIAALALKSDPKPVSVSAAGGLLLDLPPGIPCYGPRTRPFRTDRGVSVPPQKGITARPPEKGVSASLDALPNSAATLPYEFRTDIHGPAGGDAVVSYLLWPLDAAQAAAMGPGPFPVPAITCLPLPTSLTVNGRRLI